MRRSPCSIRPPSSQQARRSGDGMGEEVCVGFGLGLGERVGDGKREGVRVGGFVARGVVETEVIPST